VKLNPEERQVLKQYWLAADEKIYRHFYKIFDAKVMAFGRSTMDEEVRMLCLANQKLEDCCVMKPTNLNNSALSYYFKKTPPVHNKTLGFIPRSTHI